MGKFELSRRKRRRLQDIPLDEARLEAAKILRLKVADLLNPGKSTPLPYPGMGRTCQRPPPELNYVGREELYDLLSVWDDGPPEQFLVYGPKGVGKSTDFRALFCILYKWCADDRRYFKEQGERGEQGVQGEPLRELVIPLSPLSSEAISWLDPANMEKVEMPRRHHSRLVFLWAETLLPDEISSVKMALHFSFLPDEDEQVEAEIEQISSLDEAVDFIIKRKELHSEVFTFFVDGGEKLDALDFFNRPVFDFARILTVSNSLFRLLRTGASVWWCTSPKAKMTDLKLIPQDNLRYREGFSEEEYNQYQANCFLGRLKKDRYESILYLTGLVPLFLEVLCACCQSVADEILGSRLEFVRKSSLDPRAKIWISRSMRANDDYVVAALVEEDDYWDAVVRKFGEHNELMLVRKKASEVEVTEECLTDRDMAKLDPTYVLNADKGLYCSDYIKRIYTEAVRSKEGMLMNGACVGRLLDDPAGN